MKLNMRFHETLNVGIEGKSAYEVAVANGFEGTEKEWLDSLHGEKGDPGYTPVKNTDYFDGLSAYEIAVKKGFEGTEEAWVASLNDPDVWEPVAEYPNTSYLGSQIIPMDGKFRKCLITVEYGDEDEHRVKISCGKGITDNYMVALPVATATETYSPVKRYAAMEVKPNGGYWDMTFYGAADNESIRPISGMPKEYFMKNKISDVPYVDYVHVASLDGAIKTGIFTKIWGVRVKE